MTTSTRARLAFVLLAIVVIALTVVCVQYMRSINAAVRETNDPAQYPAVLKRLGYPVVNCRSGTMNISQFPATIPATATNVKFYFTPHFLQGGDRLRLSYFDTPARIAQALKTYAPLALPAIPNDSLETDVLNNGVSPLPKTFRIFVLHRVLPTPPDADGFSSTGVAIDPTTNEILYWYME